MNVYVNVYMYGLRDSSCSCAAAAAGCIYGMHFNNIYAHIAALLVL